MTHDTSRRTITRNEARLAYFAIARVIGLAVDIEDIEQLAKLTHDEGDVDAVATAIHEAHRGHSGGRDSLLVANQTLLQRTQSRKHQGAA